MNKKKNWIDFIYGVGCIISGFFLVSSGIDLVYDAIR